MKLLHSEDLDETMFLLVLDFSKIEHLRINTHLEDSWESSVTIPSPPHSYSITIKPPQKLKRNLKNNKIDNCEFIKEIIRKKMLSSVVL